MLTPTCATARTETVSLFGQLKWRKFKIQKTFENLRPMNKDYVCIKYDLFWYLIETL
jgi:hypothetical protein